MCAILFIRRGRGANNKDIQWPDGQMLKSLLWGESYKYVGVLESDRILIKGSKMKIEE